MGFILQFCIRSKSSEPFERFIVNFNQITISVRRCAEPMIWVCRLKVKVNFQGHGIYPLQFPVRSISPELFERFSLNLTLMFLSVRRYVDHMTQLCSLEVSVTVKVMGFTLAATYLMNPFFIKLYPNVPLSETVCRSNDSAINTLKRSWSHFKVMEFVYPSIWSYRLSPLNVTQMLPSVRRWAELMTQLRTVK